MIEVTLDPRVLGVGRKTDLTVRLTNTGPRACTELVFRLGLPSELVLLGGTGRIQALRLDPGASETLTVQVRAKTPGSHRVTSPNFFYFDGNGASRRETGFAFTLEAVPEGAPAPPSMPRLAVILETANLPSGQETVLRGRVRNVGGADFLNALIEVADPAVEQCGPSCRIGALPVGREAPFALRVRFHEEGRRVPIGLRTTGATRHETAPPTLHAPTLTVTAPRKASAMPAPDIRILYLSANPEDTERLRLDKEMREIREAIGLSTFRDAIAVEYRTAIRVRELNRALLQYRPTVVHFSGHGDVYGNYLVEDDSGNIHPLSAEAIADIFQATTDNVHCVIANACHSLHLAEALSTHVEHVIGMRHEIGDQAAIDFSIGFYQALAERRGIPKAFALGCANIKSHGHASDADVPLLFGSQD
jgi:hypothetical protein